MISHVKAIWFFLVPEITFSSGHFQPKTTLESATRNYTSQPIHLLCGPQTKRNQSTTLLFLFIFFLFSLLHVMMVGADGSARAPQWQRTGPASLRQPEEPSESACERERLRLCGGEHERLRPCGGKR